ncbi:MAG: tRNA (adenosine(37)-N6)-dimethylallyltransferase MiaA [Holosporaceae bacterium]|nr:MAG: tRNA (adenosine(37)-N6)-dimethylallyltransferase MiaA [Holosporaceae bacterium]
MTTFLICGPTGSGKSKYALHLAQKLDGIIVNADSMQLYKGMPILSAQPSVEDLKAVAHHLYAYVSPYDSFSVAKWLADVKKCIDTHAQKNIIFVGGTGLYTKALIEGLSTLPPITTSIRHDVSKTLTPLSAEEAFALLKQEDPAGAKVVDPQNKRRIGRALEVKRQTGRSMVEWHQHKTCILQTPPKTIVLQPERDLLHNAINDRVFRMLEEGAIKEVQNLTLPLSATASKTIGYQEIKAHLDGALSKQDLCEKIQAKTRQYAKRQITWFTHQMKADVIWPSLFSQSQVVRFLSEVIG